MNETPLQLLIGTVDSGYGTEVLEWALEYCFVTQGRYAIFSFLGGSRMQSLISTYVRSSQSRAGNICH